MTKQAQACCSSPATIGYWLAISLMAWGVLSLIGMYWHPLHASSPATCLLAMAIGCLANWLRNRTFHCAGTGPIFLIAGAVFLFSDARMIHVNSLWVWPFVLLGVGAVCKTFCVLPLRMQIRIASPSCRHEEASENQPHPCLPAQAGKTRGWATQELVVALRVGHPPQIDYRSVLAHSFLVESSRPLFRQRSKCTTQ
jgi:hypothetical protein